MNAITRNGQSEVGNRNLSIWQRNEATDPSATKPFSRGGGFKGTATNATYIVKRLTAEFGPVGLGWGVDTIAEDLLTGAPVRSDKGDLLGNEIVHRIRVRFWWLDPETKARCAFDQIGQTTFVGRNKNGWFTDEEAPKKSLTDALTKAASWLGFAADIHLGLWDDSKYVAERVKEEKIARADDIIDNGQKPPPEKPSASDPLQTRVDSAVRAFGSAQSLGRVEQLSQPAEALLAQVMQAKRADLRKLLDAAMTAARERLTPPDDDPFFDMPMPEAA